MSFYLSKKDLNDLVNNKIDISNKLYSQLRSKHFLYDDLSSININLLSIKYRTKFSRYSGFTSLHIFVVTLRCEHSCPYCQVSRKTENKFDFDMSKETAVKSLDLVFKSPSKNIKIEFQGGEPLLNFDLIKFIVIEAKKEIPRI